MTDMKKFIEKIDKEILKITKNNINRRLLHNGEGSINDVIMAMKEEGYNETEIAESLVHI